MSLARPGHSADVSELDLDSAQIHHTAISHSSNEEEKVIVHVKCPGSVLSSPSSFQYCVFFILTFPNSYNQAKQNKELNFQVVCPMM